MKNATYKRHFNKIMQLYETCRISYDRMTYAISKLNGLYQGWYKPW